jgi:hypothetical protein
LADEYVFHVRNAHPSDMVAVLAAIDVYPGLPTLADVLTKAEGLGFAIRDRQRLEALMTARELGFIEANQNKITPFGETISELELQKPDLFVDMVHYYQYTLWNSKRPQAYCFSWTYRSLCELLWESATYSVVDRRDVAAELEAKARSAFSRAEIALSPKSVGGALLWLTELIPSVFDENGDVFTRRNFCPPELFVLAVDYIYCADCTDYGTNLLLTEDRCETICKVCLLDPEGLDRVLDYALSQFDYLEKGIGGGWGSYLVLKRQPELQDFLMR